MTGHRGCVYGNYACSRVVCISLCKYSSDGL